MSSPSKRVLSSQALSFKRSQSPKQPSLTETVRDRIVSLTETVGLGQPVREPVPEEESDELKYFFSKTKDWEITRADEWDHGTEERNQLEEARNLLFELLQQNYMVNRIPREELDSNWGIMSCESPYFNRKVRIFFTFTDRVDRRLDYFTANSGIDVESLNARLKEIFVLFMYIPELIHGPELGIDRNFDDSIFRLHCGSQEYDVIVNDKQISIKPVGAPESDLYTNNRDGASFFKFARDNLSSRFGPSSYSDMVPYPEEVRMTAIPNVRSF